MGQEYFINSQELEDKIRQLLPSQGGAGAGFDLSASTQIIPVIDVTESAEGSNVRADLQTALSHDTVTEFNVANATTTIINNTGYFRVFGISNFASPNAIVSSNFSISDGATSKLIMGFGNQFGFATSAIAQTLFDFVVKMEAGDSLIASSSNANITLTGCTRQIADISGNLTNP